MSALASVPNLISFPIELDGISTCSEVELVGRDEGTGSGEGVYSLGVFSKCSDDALHIDLDF
jgi:hypothetical protein